MFQCSKREFLAEFLGTLVLMTFGLAVNAQVSLGNEAYGTFFSVNVAWGLAVTLGAYVAFGVTGAHLNPAVTLALAVNSQHPWRKVVPYMAAQFLAAFLASVLIYMLYVEALDQYELAQARQMVIQDGATEATSVSGEKPPRTLKTARIWATYPREFADGRWVTNRTGFLDQVLGTALLLLCICALTDERNQAPRANIAPLVIGSVVFLVGMSLGSNCQYAINPARDLSPRVFTWLAGWGHLVFRVPNTTWYLVPILGPLLGGVLGVKVYHWLIIRWHDSPAVEDDEI